MSLHKRTDASWVLGVMLSACGYHSYDRFQSRPCSDANRRMLKTQAMTVAYYRGGRLVGATPIFTNRLENSNPR